jgi:hypothetical protein
MSNNFQRSVALSTILLAGTGLTGCSTKNFIENKETKAISATPIAIMDDEAVDKNGNGNTLKGHDGTSIYVGTETAPSWTTPGQVRTFVRTTTKGELKSGPVEQHQAVATDHLLGVTGGFVRNIGAAAGDVMTGSAALWLANKWEPDYTSLSNYQMQDQKAYSSSSSSSLSSPTVSPYITGEFTNNPTNYVEGADITNVNKPTNINVNKPTTTVINKPNIDVSVKPDKPKPNSGHGNNHGCGGHNCD